MKDLYKDYLILNENVTVKVKRKLWRKAITWAFDKIDKKMDKEKSKSKRKKLVQGAYDNASEKYHKELDIKEPSKD